MGEMNDKSVERKILSAFAEGKQKNLDEIGITHSWWKTFTFKRDPFEEGPVRKEMKNVMFFQDRISILQTFARILGSATRRENFHYIAIVGEYGIGKITLFAYLHELLKNQSVNGKFLNYEGLEDLDNYKNYNSAYDIPSDIDYLILCKVFNVDRLRSLLTIMATRQVLVLVLWDAVDYPGNVKLKCSKEYILQPVPSEILISNVQKKLALFTDQDLPIEEGSYDLIRQYSYGNYFIAYFLLKNSFLIAFAQNSLILSKDIVSRSVQELNLNLIFEEKLTSKEEIILRCMNELSGGGERDRFKVKEFAKSLIWSEQLTWKYLRRLTDKGFLTKIVAGSDTYYRASPLYRIAWGKKRISALRKGLTDQM